MGKNSSKITEDTNKNNEDSNITQEIPNAKPVKKRSGAKVEAAPTISSIFFDNYKNYWPSIIVSYVQVILEEFDKEPLEEFLTSEWDFVLNETIRKAVLEYCSKHKKKFTFQNVLDEQSDKMLELYKVYGVEELDNLTPSIIYNSIYDLFGRGESMYAMIKREIR